MLLNFQKYENLYYTLLLVNIGSTLDENSKKKNY